MIVLLWVLVAVNALELTGLIGFGLLCLRHIHVAEAAMRETRDYKLLTQKFAQLATDKMDELPDTVSRAVSDQVSHTTVNQTSRTVATSERHVDTTKGE
jgi:hypothetical protein